MQSTKMAEEEVVADFTQDPDVEEESEEVANGEECEEEVMEEEETTTTDLGEFAEAFEKLKESGIDEKVALALVEIYKDGKCHCMFRSIHFKIIKEAKFIVSCARHINFRIKNILNSEFSLRSNDFSALYMYVCV